MYLCFISKLYVLGAIQYLVLLGPKWSDWRLIFFLLSLGIAVILLEDVKSMLDKVLQFSRRYLLSLFRLLEKFADGGGYIAGGGGYSSPHSANGGLNEESECERFARRQAGRCDDFESLCLQIYAFDFCVVFADEYVYSCHPNCKNIWFIWGWRVGVGYPCSTSYLLGSNSENSQGAT